MLAENLYRVASSVLGRVGVDAMLVDDSEDGEYDPETGEVATTTVEYPVRVAVMDFALISNGGLADRDTLRSSQDKQVYLDGKQLTFKIQANRHKLRVGATTYRITVVKEYNPSTTAHIMYDLKVEL